MLKKKHNIFVAGHKGLVGSAVVKLLKDNGYKKIITIDRKKLDLTIESNVNKYFKNKKVDILIMAAARAGGILANNTYKAQFYLENVSIQNNLLKLALAKKIKRTIFLGTSCIYPKKAKTPIKEEYLLSGKLESTNETYALAKIGGIKLSEALYNQFGLDVICIMPTNLYGNNDNFDPFSSHVIPGMITKIYKAKKGKKRTVKLLGTGKPHREFLHTRDLAFAILNLLKQNKSKIRKVSNKKFPMFNIGSGEVITIKQLSSLIASKLKFSGKVVFNHNFPDGTYKKNLDTRKMRLFGWKPKIKLKHGIDEILKTKFNVNSN